MLKKKSSQWIKAPTEYIVHSYINMLYRVHRFSFNKYKKMVYDWKIETYEYEILQVI